MCGICGYYCETDEVGRHAILDRMTDCLEHRGPDDRGTFSENGIGLGHRRLSILDLSTAGHQPMFSADDNHVIAFNGEVYNFREIRNELRRQGVLFQSETDTEVVLEAFRHQGEASFQRLGGMFAFAILDRGKKTITLARDRFGIKPLYYWYDGRQLMFASEIKSILKSSIVPREIDLQGFHEYLHYGTTLGKTTIFKNIFRLLPGHFLVYDGHDICISRFADVLDVQPSQDSYQQATVRVRELLEKSVQAHLVSDVPVGVFLSGGIDSACVTAFASKHYGGKLKTYSAAFDFEPENDELDNAGFVARKFNTDHHELRIHADHIRDDLESLVEYHDVPFGDVANLPLFLMCKELNGETKVILQGDGGDEIFGGYHRYARLQFQYAYKMISSLMFGLRPYLPKSSKSYRSLRTMNAFRQSPDELMACLMSQEMYDYPPTNVLRPSFVESLDNTDPFAVYRSRYDELRKLDPVQRMLYTDATVILPDLYFEKVDRSTMASSVEVRVPLVENELARYVMSLPWKYKVKGIQKKRILRDALRGIVPDRILDGPKKGLNVPFKKWLVGPLNSFMKEVLLDPDLETWGIFRRDEIEAAINRNSNGSGDHGYLLYKLLIFALWYKTYIVNAPCALTTK